MKTVEEWSNAFDVLVADYARLNQFGLESPLAFDEYEKSLFLTEAQEFIVKGIYNGTLTPYSFEGTEEARRQLAILVTDAEYNTKDSKTSIQDNLEHKTYVLPPDCWYIIYEQVKFDSDESSCIKDKTASVYPVTHDDYRRIINNPFRGPNSRRVLRLDAEDYVEIVSKYNIGKYFIRYIKKPSPIILCDLSSSHGETLEIEGENTPQSCKLPDIIHQDILEKAVQIAVATRISQQNNKSN